MDDHGEDFVVADTLAELVAGKNAITDEPLIDEAKLCSQIEARDSQINNPFSKDVQVTAITPSNGVRLFKATSRQTYT